MNTPLRTRIMKFVGAIIIFIVIHCSGVCLIAETVPVGDGIEVRVVGPRNAQSIEIFRDSNKIGGKMMRDGDVSAVLPQRVSEDGNWYNIAVRYGHDGDLYIAFAVIGDKVIESPAFRNSAKGDKGIRATWSSPDHLEIGGKQPNAFEFDPIRNKWNMAHPNSPPSKQGGFSLGRAIDAAATGGLSEVVRNTDPKKLGRFTQAVGTAGASEVARRISGEGSVNLKPIMDDFDKTIGKAERDTNHTVEKAWNDTPRTIADVGIALYDFAEKQVQYEGRQFTDFEKRAFEGKLADAVAHLGVDRFRNDEVNAAKAAQKSLILRTGGQILATVYGGPYGAAAYAAWYTYNVTKDPALSIKAGLIAGAASAATTGASGAIGKEGVARITANAIANGSIAGVAAAASGGKKDDVLRAFAIAGTSVVIQSTYEQMTKHEIDPAPSKGEAYFKHNPLRDGEYCPNCPPESTYFKNPDGSIRLDSHGKPDVDVRLLDFHRPHVGLAAGIGDRGLFYETNPVMTGISRLPVFNAMAGLHDVLCEQWNLEGIASKGTIPPALIVTYYGTQAPTMELLLRDIQKNRHE